jgi:integrase
MPLTCGYAAPVVIGPACLYEIQIFSGSAFCIPESRGVPEGRGNIGPGRRQAHQHTAEDETVSQDGAALPGVVALFKTQKAAQAADRLHAGNQWTDSGLVFTSEFGTPVDPRNILRTVQIAAAKIGIDRIGVHTLRHGAAVGWLEAGVHIKAVADLLGHSSIAVTGDIYGHTSDETARSAIEGRSGALGL